MLQQEYDAIDGELSDLKNKREEFENKLKLANVEKDIIEYKFQIIKIDEKIQTLESKQDSLREQIEEENQKDFLYKKLYVNDELLYSLSKIYNITQDSKDDTITYLINNYPIDQIFEVIALFESSSSSERNNFIKTIQTKNTSVEDLLESHYESEVEDIIHAAEGAHVIRGGMSSGETSKFDKKNGARGINPHEVLKIAQRNGVYPNKHGVLPAEPNGRIMDYVERYANSRADVEEFKRQWYLTVQKQLDKKHEKIRTENRSEYNRTRNYYETSVVPYLGNDVTYLEINHWIFMPREIHEYRMQEIIKKTVFGKFVKNSGLRVDPLVDVESYVEYYELRLPKGSSISKYEFKELYKKSCYHLGYDHQL